jgi:hypothetical protein
MNDSINLAAHVQRDRRRDPLGSGLFLYLVSPCHPAGAGGSQPAVVTDITFTRFDKNTPPPENTGLRLSEEAAQQLMEELWHAGVRPAAAAGSIGQLAAVEAHLRDMRHLAFNGAPPK